MHASIALHLDAIALLRDVLRRVDPTRLDRPTPCAGWTVRDLLAHQLGQDRAFTAALSGGSREVAAWAPIPLGDDGTAPLLAALEEQERVLGDFGDPEARTVWMPEIVPGSPLPAGRALMAHLLDLVVHSWDLAVGIGVPIDVPDDLVATCLTVAMAIPDTPDSRGQGRAFARPLDVPAGGGSFDEVLRRLGRDPAWSPATADTDS